MTLGIVLLLIAICAPVFAAVLFTEDFESGALSTAWTGTNKPSVVTAPAPGHGTYSLKVDNAKQRITRTGFSIPAGAPLAVRFYFYDQAGSKGNMLDIYTATSTQGFGFGNIDGADYLQYEMINPVAGWGNSIWSTTNVKRAFGAWQRCDIYYNGSTTAKWLVNGKYAGMLAVGNPVDFRSDVIAPTIPFDHMDIGANAPAQAVTPSYIDDIVVLTDPYMLTVDVDPNSVGMGTISGATSGYYDSSENINLSAQPLPGYDFVGWADNTGLVLDTSNPTSLSITSDFQIYAQFAVHDGYKALKLNASPAVGGTISGAGAFTPGSYAPAQAAAAAGYTFAKWSTNAAGTDTVSTANPYNVKMDNDTTLYAIFTPNTYTLTTHANTGGTASAGGSYQTNQPVTVTATPNTGLVFAGWSTDAAGLNIVSKLATYTFNMPPNNYSLWANFTPQMSFNFSDGFESRALGELDSNDSSSPNSGPTNPWWGTNPGNNDVIASNDNVRPHSGTRMIFGQWGNCVNYLNMAYRANNGNLLVGNFVVDWYFYDFIGPNGNLNASHGFQADAVTVCDYINSDLIGSDGKMLDYPPSANTANFAESAFDQRLSLGMSRDYSTGYDISKYQARIMGASGLAGQYGTLGWVNLPMTRSIGWHHGRVLVGPVKANNHNDVSFYIDNMAVPLLTADSGTQARYNFIEVLSNQQGIPGSGFWSYPTMYDDFTVASIPGVVNLLVTPSDNVSGPTVKATWDGIGAASYKLQVDNTAWKSLTSNSYDVDVTSLAMGSHTVSVKPVDINGVEGPAANATFTVNRGRIHTWAVLGFYSSNDPNVTTTSPRYATDYLAPEGSETTLGDAAHPWNSTYNGKTGFAYTAGNGIVDFNVVYNTPTTYTQWGASYLFTYIINNGPAITNAYLACGTDDGIKVYVNGQFVGGQNVYRGLTVDSDLYGLVDPNNYASGPKAFTLNPGVNTLLIKVTQGSTGYQAEARICAADKSEPSWLNQLTFTLNPATSVAKVNDLWSQSNGQMFSISGKCVSMTANGACWIEETDRTAAIKVVNYTGTATKGNLVDVSGTLNVVGTERVLTNATITDKGAAPKAIAPVAVIERSAGGKALNANTPSITDGKGLYNIGLYVRIAGSVNGVDTSDPNNKFFYLDDGSGLSDGVGMGIKVLCGSIDPPASGNVIVTGAIGTANASGTVVPVLTLDSFRAL